VQLSRLYLAWITPALYAPGDAALDLVSSILTGGKNSRLYKRLVYDLQVAQDVSARQSSGKLASYFQIEVTPRPGHTTDEMKKIVDEEIFGPVLSVLTFDSEDEGIALANRSMYGLAAGIWTKDIQKAHRVARAIKAGTVWVNTYNFYDPAAPFGGYKFSGFGRDLGREALDNYTETKTVWVGL